MTGDRVALFGGTFDPPHLGHLLIAESVREALALDRVEFLPSPDPPHKVGLARSAFDDRVAMVEVAVAGSPTFTVNRSEAERTGPSYTVDTLRLRRAQQPDESLWFLLGADSLVDLPTWREPMAIIRLARIAVAARPGVAVDLAALGRSLPGIAPAVDLVATPLIEISSRDLRGRVRDGRTIRFRTPESVRQLIVDRGLYRR